MSSGFTIFVTHLTNKKLDRTQRFMEVRREIYSAVHEELAGFFDTTVVDDRQKSAKSLLPLYRQIQLWSSKEVVKQFNKFWDVFDLKNKRSQEEINKEYTNLIIAMRKDLVGDTVASEDVRRYGSIN